jgi:hypothetical protein
MRENYSARQLNEYFQEAYGWSDKILSTIWWDVHHLTLLSMDIDTQTSVQKFIHNRSACNVREN